MMNNEQIVAIENELTKLVIKLARAEKQLNGIKIERYESELLGFKKTLDILGYSIEWSGEENTTATIKKNEF